MPSPAYARLTGMLADDRCVVLDGGVATELQRRAPETRLDDDLWGTWALYRRPDAALDVHRAYAATGCDVLSTDTWSILSAPDLARRAGPGEGGHWMDVARLGIRLARRAVEESGRGGECAVAFAVTGEADTAERRDTIELLARVLADEPPDLILLETLTLVRDPATFATIDLLMRTGLPVWVSFRRCLHGVCGVFGQHWGPPEGDLFGRAARRFEEMGVGALLVNCLPVDHVPGMISWLRDFTGLPLGVYPNLGHQAGPVWRFDEATGPREYAEMALGWREEGAQIIGGCCGVTPDHVAALVEALRDTRAGTRRPRPQPGGDDVPAPSVPAEPWRDDRGRVVYPVPMPELVIDPGVFVPTTGSYLVWKALFDGTLGEGRRCLDVGCGCGILTVQLARNGATRVHAIDIDGAAVRNTLSNAFRNGVADRVTGDTVDLYEWEPGERFDLVVASLYQMPVDPYGEPSAHRPLDYWGRTLIDHFIRLLPRLLDAGGVAYMMQLSIVGQAETDRLLRAAGLRARVVDFSFFPFGPLFDENAGQIARVEELSDAYHLRMATEDVMVAYLVEITRA